MIDVNDYHWFWGMRYQENIQGNVAPYIEHLRQDPQYYQQMKNQIAQIDNKVFFIRFFYWLFNIQQYVFFSNLLQLFEAQEQQQGKQDMMYLWEKGASFFQCGVSKAKELTVGVLQSPSSVFCHMNFFSSSPKPQSNSNHQSIKVTAAMLPYLNILNIHAQVNESINWEVIKDAYRKAILHAHPDKGGSDQEFIKIREAFDKLQHTEEPLEIDAATSQLDEIFKLWAEIQKLKRELDEYERSLNPNF